MTQRILIHEDLLRDLQSRANWARRFQHIVKKVIDTHSSGAAHRQTSRPLKGEYFKTRLTKDLRLAYQITHSPHGIEIRFVTTVLEHAVADRLHQPRYLRALRRSRAKLVDYIESSTHGDATLKPEPDPEGYDAPELYRVYLGLRSNVPESEDDIWDQVELNSEQREIAGSSGPIFLAGAPGTGKTSVATERVRTWMTDSSAILYVTFSDMLKNQIAQQCRRLGVDGKERQFLSFRELCLRNIEQNQCGQDYEQWLAHNKNWSARDQVSYNAFRLWWNQRANRTMVELSSADAWRAFQQNLTPYIIRNRHASKLGVLVERLDGRDDHHLRKLSLQNGLLASFKEYRQWLENANRWDLATLSTLAELAGSPTQRFEQVIVDEVQDLTVTQAEFCARFCESAEGLFFAGDEAQILYGSGFEWTQLRKDVYALCEGSSRTRETKLQTLSTSYRCPASAMKLFEALARARSELDSESGNASERVECIRKDNRILIFSQQDVLQYKEDLPDDWSTQIAFIYYADGDNEAEARKRYTNLLGEDCPNLYNVESCKGLEFEVVVLLDMMVVIRRILDAAKDLVDVERQVRRQEIAYMTVATSRALQDLVFLESVDCAEIPVPGIDWHRCTGEDFVVLADQMRSDGGDHHAMVRRAKSFWDSQDWETARLWYKRAHDARWQSCEAQIKRSEGKEAEAAVLFEKGGDLDLAHECFHDARKQVDALRVLVNGDSSQRKAAYQYWQMHRDAGGELTKVLCGSPAMLDWLAANRLFVPVFNDSAPHLKADLRRAIKGLARAWGSRTIDRLKKEA